MFRIDRGNPSPVLAGLLVLAVLATAAGLSRAPLQDVDEATYARIARTMVETGDWVVPRYRDAPSFLKPPLYYWAVAASFVVQGFTERAVRSVSLLAAIVTLLLTYGIARRTRGTRAALVPPLLLATCPGFFVLVRASTVDMTLTAWVTLSLYGFVRGHEARDARPDAAAFLALWGGMALATLTKGPIGTLVPLTVIALHLLVTKRARRIARLGWLPGILLWAAVVLPWYVLTTMRLGVVFLERNLLYHNLAKYFVPGLYHTTPGAFFLAGNLFWVFFPWVVPLIAYAIARAWRWRGVPDGDALAAVWFLFPLVLFSLSRFKMPSYLAPTLPACALLAARPVAGWLGLDEESPTARGARSALVLAAVATCGVVFLSVAAFFPVESRALRLAPLAAAFVLPPAIVRLARRPGGRTFAFAAGVLAFTAGLAFAGNFLEPRIAAYAPYRAIGQTLCDRYADRAEVHVFRSGVTASLLFYSGNNAAFHPGYEELDALRRERGALLLIEGPEYDALPADWRAGLPVIAQWPLFHVAQPTGRFLLARSRASVVRRLLLVETNP
jgi:4-amino-4-deoxy-L-arabinose transferase-like glycosyltransferase